MISIDAKITTITRHDIGEKKLNKNILKQIEDDLDIDEKLSILFLITVDYTSTFQTVYNLFKELKEQKLYIITEFLQNNPENWKNKVLEAICIINNQQVVRKLGISFSDLELIYVPKCRLYAKNINPVAKCLYMLCEALTKSQTKLLLRYIKDDLSEYDINLENIDLLELHMLYWMQQKYISIYPGNRVNLKNLLKHLKKFDELELIYEDLKKFENHQNVLDNHNANLTDMPQLDRFSRGERTHVSLNPEEEDVKTIKRGLCIIINQAFFSGQKYETRFGTTADCDKLTQTFEGFGFKVSVIENVKKCEMLEKLANIPKEFGTDYDCIFICVLSHGCKGGIIASDEEEVMIETIEQKVCCLELKDVIKVVIIQACQGEITGQIKNPLTTDSPSQCNVSNIAQYSNFCIFMSTMQGFVSVRHKEQGSWFIQEFCNVLQNRENNVSFSQAAMKIIQTVEKKRGKLDGADCVAQLPELRSYRLRTDFYLPKYRPRS